jgi:hypothetical protein
MAQINKTEALRIVFTSAALYEKNLSGNNVMFATAKDGQYEQQCAAVACHKQGRRHCYNGNGVRKSK